jgi:quinol monooxygenase YgiN
MKFIIGWIICRPGTRDGFIERTMPMAAATRAEPGCVFFELSAKADEPDTAILMECFKDEAAHAHHQTLPHFPPLIAELRAVMIEGRTRHHFADETFPM